MFVTNPLCPHFHFCFTIVISSRSLVNRKGNHNLNDNRKVLNLQRILSKDTGRKLVMGGVMLLVIGFLFLLTQPQVTYYRVIGIIGAVELFIGLVMYQTFENPK